MEQSGWMDVVGVEVVEVVVLVIIAYKLVKPNRKLHLSVSFLLRHHSSENHPDPNPNPNPNLHQGATEPSSLRPPAPLEVPLDDILETLHKIYRRNKWFGASRWMYETL